MLFIDNIKNDIKIYIIQIDVRTTIIYTLCKYKFYFNWYNKYYFFISLADIAKNIVGIFYI